MGIPKTVFVWTLSDIIDLAILGLALLIGAAFGILILRDKVKHWWRKP